MSKSGKIDKHFGRDRVIHFFCVKIVNFQYSVYEEIMPLNIQGTVRQNCFCGYNV